MHDHNIGFEGYLSARQVASMLRVSLRTLARWHEKRIGPARVRVGRRILYRIQAVRDWLYSIEEGGGAAVTRSARTEEHAVARRRAASCCR